MIFDEYVWIPKALIHGGCSSAGTVFLCGTGLRSWIPMLGNGVSVPLWAIAFVSGAAAGSVSDAIHIFVKDEIHIKQKAQDEAAMFLGALVSGLLYYGTVYAVNSGLAGDIGYVKSFAVGAGAELAASFLSNML